MITIAGVILLANGTQADEFAEIDPSTNNQRLIKVQAGHAVWLVSKLHPKTARYKVQTFTHSFYQQRVEAQKAKLVYQIIDTNVSHRIAIRDDGSMLLDDQRGDLHSIPIEGPRVIEDLGSYHALTIFPDGVLATDRSKSVPKQLYPVFFVPFDGKRLRFNERVQVTASGVKRFSRTDGLHYPGEPYRHKNHFIWIADSTLHVFDLETKVQTQVKLGMTLHPGYGITAADGNTVVSHGYVFDRTTGELLGEPEPNKRPRNVISVFAVRNRIGYYYHKDHLMATDLTSRDGRSIELLEVTPVEPQQTDEGLTVWTGKRWTHVPWLKELHQQ